MSFKEKKLDYLNKFRLSCFDIESTNEDLYLIIANISYVVSKTDLSLRDVIIIIYLYELGLFSLQIRVFGVGYNVGYLLEKGYIKEDYSYKTTKLYCLTEMGFEIIDLFNKSLLQKEDYVLQNRKTKIDNKSLDVVLKYIDKKTQQ